MLFLINERRLNFRLKTVFTIFSVSIQIVEGFFATLRARCL